MPIKLVVFDIAGITIKDDHNVSKAFQATLKKFNYDISLNMTNPLMGYEKNQAIAQMLRLHKAAETQVTGIINQ